MHLHYRIPLNPKRTIETSQLSRGGDDDDGIDGTYDLAPFNFIRHGVSILGGRYGASVGMFGQAFFWDTWGTAFVPTGTNVPLYDVWQTGSVDSMFMVGGSPFDDDAYIVRFLNGERTSMDHPIDGAVTAIDGNSYDRLYAVGADGTISEFWGGDLWPTFWVEPGASFTDIWVAGPRRFWASGTNGAVYHFDGSDLVDKSIPVSENVWAICGVSPDTVYAVAGDKIYEIKSSGDPQLVFTQPTGYELLDIHAGHPDWIVAVGEMGRVATYNGSGWDSDFLYTTDDLTAVWTGTVGAEVWGTEGAHYLYALGWRPLCISNVNDWDDVHVYARDTAYGLLDGQLWEWDGAFWARSLALADVHLGGLFAVRTNQVWAYDIPTDIDHYAYYFNGSSWSSYWIGSMDTPNDIWCDDQDEVVMVGPYGSTWRYDPGTSNFTPGSVGAGANNLNGVWGYSTREIYAVGDGGAIYHSGNGGETWAALTSNTSEDLNDVWGWDDNHLVAVGENGTVMLFSPPSAPGEWARLHSGVNNNLEYVWAGDSDDIWVADGGDLVMHYDGVGWKRYRDLPNVRVRGISGYMGTPPVFVCDEDFVFQYVPSQD